MLARGARDWTGLCAHCHRARAEKPALAKSQADGKIRNCRAPGEFAWLRPTDGSPQPRNLRTLRHRFPCRSLDTRPRGKARTSGRLSAQRKRLCRRYVPPTHSAGEFFLCPGSPEYASLAVHLLRQSPPSAQALRGGRPVLQPHAVPICLPGAWAQFTLSSDALITVAGVGPSGCARVNGAQDHCDDLSLRTFDAPSHRLETL